MRLLLGAYGTKMGGSATGIGVLHSGDPSSSLAGTSLTIADDAVQVAGSPSWLAQHPSLDVVYGALEGAGGVQAFRRIGEERFVALGGPIAAGESPCHIAVDPGGSWLLASCWSDGRVVRFPLDAAGRLGKASVAPEAVDPWGDPFAESQLPDLGAAADADLAAASRALQQAVGDEFAHLIPDYSPPELELELESAVELAPGDRISHAHESVLLPNGLVATIDMGFDLVRFWRPVDGGLKLRQQVVLPRGSGPRHGVWHPSGHLYVVTELSGEVFALSADASGTWAIVGGAPFSPAFVVGVDQAAEICLSRDAETVYAGVRGSNTIAVLRVRAGGAEFTTIALADTGVDWPRHHVVARDTLLVAGQQSGQVSALTLDVRTGIPGRVRSVVSTPSPTCLLPLG